MLSPTLFSIEDLLLNSKALPALPQAAGSELDRIQKLAVTGFSEADVREEIITPLIRLLGYDKGSIFSIEREKKIDFLEKDLYVDYNVTLWNQNFWLIEAKRPRSKNPKAFRYKDLAQAVEYAVHPEINAALIVLCDGHSIEIFDREVSLLQPVLRVLKKNISRDFHQIRALLGPWQVWFFEKRRVIRLIDRVFNKEFNLGRVEEFRALVNRRLSEKRLTILDNFRSQEYIDHNDNHWLAHLATADTSELVDVHFFIPQPLTTMKTMVRALVERCKPSSFPVIHKIFPDNPRDANDSYFSHALMFLMTLAESHSSIAGLPAFLSQSSTQDRNASVAIQRLLALCLSHFQSDPARKAVLLYAAGARRFFKAYLVIQPDLQRQGQALHALTRHLMPELSWAQVLSSPEHHLLQQLDNLTMRATVEFVNRCSDNKRHFQVHTAEQECRELWRIEQRLLNTVRDYKSLLAERNLGELYNTEAIDVIFDYLGHTCLCVVDLFPSWKAYLLHNHLEDIKVIASLNSGKAREWLGVDQGKEWDPPDASIAADRFFFGDQQIFKAICSAYQFHITRGPDR